MNNIWPLPIIKLLRKWKSQVSLRERAHRNEANVTNKKYYALGGVALMFMGLSAIGGVSSFTNIAGNSNSGQDPSNNTTGTTASSLSIAGPWLALAGGIIAIIAGILGSCQTFCNYQADSAAHKQAADEYSGLYTHIEELLESPSSRGEVTVTLQMIRSKFDSITKNSPTIDIVCDLDYTPATSVPPAPLPDDAVVIEMTKQQPPGSVSDSAAINDLIAQKEEEECIIPFDLDDENQRLKFEAERTEVFIDNR